MTVRKSTIEHVFGTLKHWMGGTHFLTRGIENVATEMNLSVLAYNFKRVLRILGFERAKKAMQLLGAWAPFAAACRPDLQPRAGTSITIAGLRRGQFAQTNKAASCV